MTVYENYNVIEFKSCIQKFTVYVKVRLNFLAELVRKKIQGIEEHPLKFKAPTAISSPLIIITHCNSRQKIATTFSSSR